MADAVRSFDQLERCAVTLQSSSFGATVGIDEIEWPIVSFQVQLPVIQERLDQLRHVNVATCPDTPWVLRLGDARATAVLRLRTVTQSLYRSPLGTGPLDGRLAVDIKKLAEALHRLRQVIAQQCPEVLRTP
jgi:hypothetical protein